jgi:hypothetical protein
MLRLTKEQKGVVETALIAELEGLQRLIQAALEVNEAAVAKAHQDRLTKVQDTLYDIIRHERLVVGSEYEVGDVGSLS